MAIIVPTRVCDIHMFVGLVNYYIYMWRKRAHTLAPLTKLYLTKVNFKWIDVEHYYFVGMEKIVGHVVPLYYHNFSETFTIHTDFRKKQLRE